MNLAICIVLKTNYVSGYLNKAGVRSKCLPQWANFCTTGAGASKRGAQVAG
jgi:hypothetical protein